MSRREIEIAVRCMIIDSKARHVNRHYAILPSPTLLLCEFVVANPLDCFTTGKRLDFISDAQVLHSTIARRSRNFRTLQKAATAAVVDVIVIVIVDVIVIVVVVTIIVIIVVVLCRCGLFSE